MTTFATSTLRPGLLVSLKTALRGGVSYEKIVLEREHQEADGVERAKWETTRTVADREEHDAGRKAQMAARVAVVKACTNTAFGLLCPEANAKQLDDAIIEARKIAMEYNKTARISRLEVYVIAGRVAADDVEALRAINNEVRTLVQTMQDGIKNVNAQAIRKAADEAKRLGEMLTPEAAGRIAEAIDVARAAARKIVKAADQAAQEVDLVAIKNLEECRTSFLDLDEAKEVATPAADSRALDLVPEAEVKAEEPQAPEKKPAAKSKKKAATPKKAAAKSKRK